MDVVRGDGPAPSFVLALVEGMPVGSMLSASQQKNPELFGFTSTNAMLADLYDAIMFNTRASGQWKKSPPKFPPYPRPAVKPPKKEGGVAELHARMNAGQIESA